MLILFQKILFQTPLIIATYNRHKDIVEYLVSQGADLDIKNYKEKKAIDFAIEKKNLEIKNILENPMIYIKSKKIF